MTNANEPINAALEKNEGTINIDLLNKANGTTYPQAVVLETNTLGQILEEYAADIGINPKNSKIIFTNKRTSRETSNVNETVKGFELREGDVLAIVDDGGVA